MNPLAQLALHFTLLSFIAVGGVTSVIPEVHRQAVDINHWVTDAEFADLFALSRANPGPNMLIVTLLGWKAAGLAGAAVATVAICGPSCVITYALSRLWARFHAAPWRRIVQNALAPVTIGLVLASGYVVTVAAAQSWVAYAITGATVVLVVFLDVNPMWIVAASALLGIAGLV
jgi:chromate transporter